MAGEYHERGLFGLISLTRKGCLAADVDDNCDQEQGKEQGQECEELL